MLKRARKYHFRIDEIAAPALKGRENMPCQFLLVAGGDVEFRKRLQKSLIAQIYGIQNAQQFRSALCAIPNCLGSFQKYGIQFARAEIPNHDPAKSNDGADTRGLDKFLPGTPLFVRSEQERVVPVRLVDFQHRQISLCFPFPPVSAWIAHPHIKLGSLTHFSHKRKHIVVCVQLLLNDSIEILLFHGYVMS